jgi:hypothetical protein
VRLTFTHTQSHPAVAAPQIAVPAALGMAALIAGQYGGGLMLLGMAALAALAFYLWWVARLRARDAGPSASPQSVTVYNSYWPRHPAPQLRMLAAGLSPGIRKMCYTQILVADTSNRECLFWCNDACAGGMRSPSARGCWACQRTL